MSRPGGDGLDADGVGGIDIQPEAAAAMMAAIATAAENMRTAWAASLGTIVALDSQLGHGPLGRDFAANYNPSVAGIRENVDLMQQSVENLASVGAKIVQSYTNADQRAGQSFQF